VSRIVTAVGLGWLGPGGGPEIFRKTRGQGLTVAKFKFFATDRHPGLP
jgi:hypothetical protein